MFMSDASGPCAGAKAAKEGIDERAALVPSELSINGGSVFGSTGANSAKAVQVACWDPERKDDAILARCSDGRYPCLDVIRIFCVWLVCVDHGGTSFGHWNVMFVQSWVLQYLFLICGICFAISSRSLSFFLSRLGLYFAVGMACNWAAWTVLGKDPRTDLWNVIFQFWFVVALMIFVIWLAPIRHILRMPLLETADLRLPTCFLLMGAGCLCIAAVCHKIIIPLMQALFAAPLSYLAGKAGHAAEFWGMPGSESAAEDFISDFLTYFQVSAYNLFIVVAFPKMHRDVTLVAWLLIGNVYLHKALLYRAQEARLINAFDFTLLGLVCYSYGLKWRWIIGEYMLRYWFVMLFICAILWKPGTYGRFDEAPPQDFTLRATYNMIELVCLLFFLTAAERSFSPKIFTIDKLEFLGNWALFLFLVHKAVHLLVPAPFNWVVLISLIIPCYALYERPKRHRSTSDNTP